MCVSIIKGKQQPREPIYVLLHYRHGQVLLGKPADRESNTQTPCEHIYEPHGKWRLTWSQRAISRVFQRDTPVVSSRFMLPRNTTRFTRWFLQLACWRQRQGENVCFQQCLRFIFLAQDDACESWGSIKDNISCPSPSSDLEDGPRARLNDAHLFILAAGGQQAAVSVEGHAEDDVSVAVNHFHRLSDLQIPDQDLSRPARIMSVKGL